MSGFVSGLLRRRVLVLALLGASVVGSLFMARHIQFRFQYSDFYDHPRNARMPLLRAYHAKFGDPGGYVVVLIQARDVFAPDVLRYADRVHHALEAFPVFRRVISLPNASFVRATDDGIDTSPVVRDGHVELDALDSGREAALRSSLLRRTLVSEDSTSTAVLAEMRVPTGEATIAEMDEAIAAVKSVTANHTPPPGVRVTVTGAPVVESATTKALQADQSTLTPFVVLMIAAALFVTFRSFAGLIVPLTAVCVSVIWTAGFYGWLGRPVDLTASVIPTILLVYGVVDPIFVMHRYRMYAGRGAGRTDSIVRAVTELLLPCFLTSISTALGFAAFAFSTLPTVRYFGLAVAVGVLFAFVTTLIVTPTLLSFTAVPVQRRANRAASFVDNCVVSLWRLIKPNRRVVTFAVLLLIAVGGVLSTQLRIDAKYVALLPSGSLRQTVRTLEKQLNGVVRLAAYFTGPRDAMSRPAVLRAIAEVDREIEREHDVNSSTSLSDVIADANEAFHDGDPSAHTVPDSPNLIAQYLQLMDPKDRSSLVDNDYSHSQIRILMTDEGSSRTHAFIRKLQRALDAQHFERLGVEATITGLAYTAREEADHSVGEMLQGFVLAFVIIVIIEWITFRSALLALASVIPNVLPVVACFATMVFLGWDLQTDNAIVLCVSIGGLFNTTIQFVANLQRRTRDASAADIDSAIERTLRTVAPPALYTASILTAGFLVLLSSRFPGLRQFGTLCAVTLITAFVADILVTPAVMRMVIGWQTARSAGAAHVQPRARAILDAGPADHG